MAWNWETWKSWTTQTGITVRLLILSGLIGGGALLWYDRDDPRYPTVYDSAEIMAALLERHLALKTTNDLVGINMISGHVIPDGETTNAIGLYPSRGFFLSHVPNQIRQIFYEQTNFYGYTYLDLWNTNAALSGWHMFDGANFYPTNQYYPGEDWNFPPSYNMSRYDTFIDWYADIWWVKNICANFAYTNNYAYPFYYLTNTQYYVTTGMLHEIGRALSAMRWTVSDRLFGTYNRTYWLKLSERHYPDDTWYDVWTDLKDNWDDAFVEGETNIPDTAFIYQHRIELSADFSGPGIIGELFEFVLWSTNRIFYPAVTSLIANVHDSAVFNAPPYSGDLDHLHFLQMGAAISNRFEWTESTLIDNGDGEWGYRANASSWYGRILLDFIDYNETNCCYGFELDNSSFIIDWNFQHFNDHTKFW
jgi:hypothetical protein